MSKQAELTEEAGNEIVARMNAGRAVEAARNGRLHPLALAVDEAVAALALAVAAYHDGCITERKNTRRDSHGDVNDHILGNAASHIRATVASYDPLWRFLDLTPTNPAFALTSLHPAPAVPAEPQKPRGLQDFLRPKA